MSDKVRQMTNKVVLTGKVTEFEMKTGTIQNGEKLIFSVAIGIGTLNTPPTIRVTSQLKNSY